MRCAWPSRTAQRPVSRIGCTWRSARSASRAAPRGEPGLVVANPPYGERIGAESGLPELYSELGRVLRERFRGWQAAILTGNPPLARNLGIYAKRTHRVFNGTIECRLLRFDLNEASEQRPAEKCAPIGRAGPARRCSPIGCARTCSAWIPGPAEHIDCFRRV